MLTSSVHKIRRARVGAALLALIAVGAATVAAAASRAGVRPDRTFGAGRGYVVTRIRGLTAQAYGVTVQGDGKIVAVGQALNSKGFGQIAVVRYLRNGRLDRGFGSGGIFRTALPAAGSPYIANAVVQDRKSRKLLLGGNDNLGNMLAVRLTPGGRLDRTFGQNRSGVATIALGGGTASSIALAPRGRILVGGANSNADGRPMAVARLSANGKLDRSYGSGGVAQILFWNPKQAAGSPVNSLAVARDGSVTANGHIDYIGTDGHGSAGMFRLSSSGRLARGFGRGGHVEIAFKKRRGGFGFWFPCAMGVDRRGRILVTGDGNPSGPGQLLTARLTRRGALDRSYGRSHNGQVVLGGLADANQPTCGATVSSNGTLTAGVESTLAQLGPNGVPNRRFGPRGLFKIRRPRGLTLNGVAAAGTNAVVLTGSPTNGIYSARYLLP